MGLSSPPYANCRGQAFILEGQNFTTLNTKPGKKIKLALCDGRGLALEHAFSHRHGVGPTPTVPAGGGGFDATGVHFAYTIRMTSAVNAAEVEFKTNGEVVVTASHYHHHLGLTLDNWDGIRKVGNRQHFSDWHGLGPTPTTPAGGGPGQWQFNEDDGTISPSGARHLVLGWYGHAQLVKRDDSAQLRFIRPGCTKDKVSFLLEQSVPFGVWERSVREQLRRAGCRSVKIEDPRPNANLLLIVDSQSLKLMQRSEAVFSYPAFSSHSKAINCGQDFDVPGGACGFSMCFKVRVDGPRQNQGGRILSKRLNKGWELVVPRWNGLITFWTSDAGHHNLGSTRIDDGQWHHCAVVHDGNILTCYLDGNFDGQQPFGEIRPDCDADLWIGSRAGEDALVDGEFKELYIYNRQLSPEEIITMIESPL